VAPSAVYTEYPDPPRDEWATKMLPRLKATLLRELMERTGLPRSTFQAIRAGRIPHRKNQSLLQAAPLQLMKVSKRRLVGRVRGAGKKQKSVSVVDNTLVTLPSGRGRANVERPN
jgi:hypothetical protein